MLKRKVNEIPITKLCELNLKSKSEIENYLKHGHAHETPAHWRKQLEVKAKDFVLVEGHLFKG